MTMEKTMKLCLRTMLLLVLLQTSAVSGDVGTASAYYSPYIPTRCWGNDQSRFPANSMFVSVSEVMWDNGAACGRRYRVRCLAGDSRPCKAGYVDVVVVDACRRYPCSSTLLLSADAFGAISRIPSQRISVEYIQI
ncbi:EG45-like domain containing protein 2 [Nymphaea colorata]|nr:EG45-like domain containing protein 2 [Nymphaea colorata]